MTITIFGVSYEVEKLTLIYSFVASTQTGEQAAQPLLYLQKNSFIHTALTSFLENLKHEERFPCNQKLQTSI